MYCFYSGPHGGLPVVGSPPTPFSRQLTRLPSTSGFGNGGGMPMATGEWRANVAVEERINIRRKLREAYSKHCPTYEQLLETVVAVDEELLFSCSTNRIDYFKSSIDWDARIQLKRQQLKGSAAAQNGPSTVGDVNSKKRPADDLSGRSVSLLNEIGINNSDLLPPQTLLLPSVSQLGESFAPSSSSSSSTSESNSSSALASSLVSLGESTLPGVSGPANKKQRNN